MNRGTTPRPTERQPDGVHQEGSWGDLLDKLRGEGMYGPKAGIVARRLTGAVWFLSSSEKYKSQTELLCLPDTVDPREPKWK